MPHFTDSSLLVLHPGNLNQILIIFGFSEVLRMDSRSQCKKFSNTFFVCSLPEHTRVYDCPQGVMEGGVNA